MDESFRNSSSMSSINFKGLFVLMCILITIIQNVLAVAEYIRFAPLNIVILCCTNTLKCHQGKVIQFVLTVIFVL